MTTEVTNNIENYVKHFERIEREYGGSQFAWLTPLRKAAIARFVELGFPTTRHEDWKWTNVAPIAQTDFAPATTDESKVSPQQVAGYGFDVDEGARLVFVNGRFVQSLSDLSSLPNAITVMSLNEAIRAGNTHVQQHLGRHASHENQPFTALNTAMMEDGVFIHVPRGTVVEQPIHAIYISTDADNAFVAYPRNLVIADVSSEVSFVETFAGIGDTPYFNDAVTEIVAHDNAIVHHYKLEREGENSYHISTLQIHQFRDSDVTSHALCMGRALVRNDINALLDGEGCEATLNGLYLCNGEEHVDNHLWVDHAKPRCNSREYFKGVLDGSGRGIFSGKIIVREDAQKTDAKQSNMSLLLSDSAQVESNPQLEIFADDVKCTHGATIGQVDEDAMFYLRTRGLTEETARSVLIFAFARERLDDIKLAPLRVKLEELLLERLPQGELLREAI